MTVPWRIATATVVVASVVAIAVVAVGSDDAAPVAATETMPKASGAPITPSSAASPASPTTASASGNLAPEQAAALTYIREEEKLARDVYLVLAGTSGDRRFTMIGRSEQQHFDMVGELLAAYDLPDPALGRKPGAFTDPALQDAYDDFVRRGTTSRAAALAVGREIERMDIADLAARRADLPQADIRAVLDRLAAGSERHLAAFSR